MIDPWTGMRNWPPPDAAVRVDPRSVWGVSGRVASGGTAVTAAGSGQVAAITRDSAGTPIIVVRHEGDLMSVYTNLGDVAVAKGDSVSAGQSLGQAGDAGFVHFEIRRGFESVDPERYLN